MAKWVIWDPHKKLHIFALKSKLLKSNIRIMEDLEPPTVIIAALSALSPPHLSDLSHSIFSDIHHSRRRLTFILSSPTLFSLTLRHLNSLSLSHKSLLIARFLLSALRRLSRPFQPPPNSLPHNPVTPRDLDAAVLLLLLCEVRQQNPAALRTPITKWRATLCRIYSDSLLTVSGIATGGGGVLIPYIEMVARCWKFVGFVGSCGGKARREVAASPVAVVELPSVAVGGGGAAVVECVICKEEMNEGRDACQLPCEHLFHWLCILPWLRKRNTCPCCRFQLPTDDIFGEIQRLWEILVKVASSSYGD